MFTLGKTPYPGIEPGERFYDMLVKGYRQVKRYNFSIRATSIFEQPAGTKRLKQPEDRDHASLKQRHLRHFYYEVAKLARKRTQ
jgi:hypothetical protein